MKLTNKLGLPKAFVKAIENDDYNAGKSDISVTSLIDSPRIHALKRKHDNEIEEDVIDRVWALFGTAVHYVLEKNSEENVFTEERLFADFFENKSDNSYIISGMVDYMTEKSIEDFKVTSVWSIVYDSRRNDWEKQLNVYRWLAKKNGFKNIKELKIHAILRDWQVSKAKFDKAYPQTQVVTVPLQLWSMEETVLYISDRIKSHTYLKDLPLCSNEERWKSDDVYAVTKTGRKSAVALRNTEQEAKELVDAKWKGSDGYALRKGSCRRCEEYCSVNKFCDQYQKEKQNG